MATEDMLSKVKSDIFAILIPGTFVTGVLVSGVLVFTQYDSKTGILERFGLFFEALKGNWILTFIVFIMIFLIGSLLRTIRVNRVDKIAVLLFRRFIKNQWDKDMFDDSFPYPTRLGKVKEGLLKAKIIEDFTLPKEKDDLYNLYNYWKVMICIDAPCSFSIAKELEGRVRMFAGMFWAGCLGILGSMISTISFLYNHSAWSVWRWYVLWLFLLSMIMAITFGLNLKRVRGEEVSSVFLAFLYLHKKIKSDEKKEKAKEKGNVFGPLMSMFKSKEKE